MTPPGVGPLWTPGVQLAGFIKRNIIYCYKQNMKALSLVVSEKKIFLCFTHDPPPQGGACMNPRGTVGRIYKEDHYTLLLTKYESSGPCGFGEEDFFMFFHCKSMGANDPRGGAIFDSRSMIGRIYKKDHYTLLHTKYEGSGTCDFGEDDFFYVLPHHAPGRIYKEDHYTLLHTKYERSGTCGFGEEDFFMFFPL